MISAEFRQNVASGDLDTVRSALIDYLIIDRSFTSFNEALDYAQNTLDIIEPFNNEPPLSEEPWDNNYLNQEKVALMMNFSAERINHIKQVISKVLPANGIEKQQVSGVTHSSTPVPKRTGSKTGRTVVSEKTVQSRSNTRTQTNGTSIRTQEKTISTLHSSNHSTGGSGKTGTKVIRETVSSTKQTEDKKKSDTDLLSTVLIVGGVTVTVVGIATIESVVIGAGVVITGAGVGLKVKKGR